MVRTAFLLAFLAADILLSQDANHQAPPISASDLIRYLTYQSDRPDKHGYKKGMPLAFSCGPSLAEDRDNRALAKSLVDMGGSALPALEEALASLEAHGLKSEFATDAGWLVWAYARLKGCEAFPRLQRMCGQQSKLALYPTPLDNAIAQALGLTSYISPLREAEIYPFHRADMGPWRFIHCDRPNEPRDTLDRLIMAWQMDDRVSLEASLGPNAKLALDQLLGKRTLKSVRAGISSEALKRNGALGYRFDVLGRWSEPDETLDAERPPATKYGDAGNFAIDTFFYNRFGRNCGQVRLTFSEFPELGWHDENRKGVPGPIEYLIDNSNLIDLLRVTVKCTTDTVRAN